MNIPRSEVLRRYGYVFVVLITLMGCVPVAFAQDWMPDANLRTAVRSALNLDCWGYTHPSGYGKPNIELTAKNSQISNITGLDHATNLETLDLRDNTISNINAISGLTGLETLKLKGNTLSSITPLSGLTSLTPPES